MISIIHNTLFQVKFFLQMSRRWRKSIADAGIAINPQKNRGQQSAVRRGGSETLLDSGERKIGMEGGRKSGSVSEVRKSESRLTGYAIGGTSMEEDLNSLNFLIVEQQKEEDFLSKKKTFRCMLFNYFNIYSLNCLRVPQTHAIPTFPDFKMCVYGE